MESESWKDSDARGFTHARACVYVVLCAEHAHPTCVDIRLNTHTHIQPSLLRV